MGAGDSYLSRTISQKYFQVGTLVPVSMAAGDPCRTPITSATIENICVKKEMGYILHPWTLFGFFLAEI